MEPSATSIMASDWLLPLSVLLAVLVAPVVLKLLEHVLPLVQERIAASAAVLREWMPRIFRWSGELLTDGGELSPTQAIAQSVGAILMMAFAVAFITCELQFTWATLCPMFGGTCTGEAFAGYDKLLAFSSVLLAIEFGVIATDLLGVTYTTHFARIERARVFFLVLTVVCGLLTISVGGAMAWYRDLILGMGQSEIGAGETTMRIQELQTMILTSLAALLLIGAVLAGSGMDMFWAVVLAALGGVSGVVVGSVYVVLQSLALVTEALLGAVKTLRDIWSTLSAWFCRCVERIRSSGRALLERLRVLVAPRKGVKTVGASDMKTAA